MRRLDNYYAGMQEVETAPTDTLQAMVHVPQNTADETAGQWRKRRCVCVCVHIRLRTSPKLNQNLKIYRYYLTITVLKFTVALETRYKSRYSVSAN